MDITKIEDFFSQDLLNANKIHIIGCGAIGSTLAENLARCGIGELNIWDFDIVESANVSNQMYRDRDIGKKKVDALEEILKEINPHIMVKGHPKGWNGQPLGGYVFLCVDSIKTRRDIIDRNFHNLNIKAVFDFRTLLKSAQHYAARWDDAEEKEMLKGSMDFTDEEASAATPTSACGITLGVVTTNRMIVAFGVNNFINLLRKEGFKRLIIADGFMPSIVCD